MQAIIQEVNIIPSANEDEVRIDPNANATVPTDPELEAIVRDPYPEIIEAEPMDQEHETAQNRETAPLIENYHEKFRRSRRAYRKTCKEKSIIVMLKFVFATAGYSARNVYCCLYAFLLFFLAIFQLGYDCYIVFYCPNTHCKFQVDHRKNETENPTRTIQNISYTCASAGGLLSFILMALTLYHKSGKKCKNAITL